MRGPSACADGSSEAGLETLKAHRSDGKEEGESLRLSLARQESQVVTACPRTREPSDRERSFNRRLNTCLSEALSWYVPCIIT